MQWKFLPDGSFGDPAFNLWPEFVGCPSVEEGSPPMLKVHIRPLVNLPERGGFRSRVREVSCYVVIGRREISRAQLIGKSTERGKTGIQIMEKEENSIWKRMKAKIGSTLQ